MKNFHPKVSIVIPVYNGSRHLGEAIDSALAQTYPNIEIIVSNDGSNDNGATEAVAKSYGDKIIYLGKKENGGASTALNAAIKVMTGEYFSWLSHDDMYYPDKIKRQVEELAKLPDKNTIMMSDLDGINEKREKIYETSYKNHIADYPLREKSYIHPVIYNQTHGCTLLIPKVCFDEAGLFDEGERVAQDFECFYRIFQKFPHKLVPEVLVTARDTSNRMGRRAKPRADVEYSRLYIKILENITDSEVKLLANSKFTLLSDMWGFFKAAGYTIALNYADKALMDTAKTHCSDLVSDFQELRITKTKLIQAFTEVEDQLVLVLGDKKQAVTHVDKAIKEHILGIKKDVSGKSQERLLSLHNLLIEVGYKQSASHLIKEIILAVAKQKRSDNLKKIIADHIIGDESLLTEKDIKTLLQKRANQKTRIIFCSTHWLTGGMERVMSLVFEQLKSDYEIYLLTPSDGRAYMIALPDYVNHIKISNSMFYRNFDSAALSVSLILGVDVLIGVYNLFEKQLNLYDLCRSEGIKTIASNHEYFYYPYFNYDLNDLAVKRLEAFSGVDAVVWPTNFSAAVSDLGSKNSYLMPNPNTFNVDKNVGLERDDVIICAGRFNDYIKRIDRILECFKLVQDKVPESKLLIVGDCDRKQKNDLFRGKSIDDMIIELGIDENNITFAGNVSNIGDYYARAKVLVLASGSEGFGMVINEAACFGVPTVYNAIPGLEDLVVDGENGFVVPQGDAEAMADKVVSILSDDDLHARLSQGAQKIVEKFNSDTIGERWRYLISSLVSSQDVTKLRDKLQKKLAYSISNHEEFEKAQFNEFNKLAKELADTKGRTQEVVTGRYIGRLRRSLKEHGKKRTAKKALKKVYVKTKSIVKG